MSERKYVIDLDVPIFWVAAAAVLITLIIVTGENPSWLEGRVKSGDFSHYLAKDVDSGTNMVIVGKSGYKQGLSVYICKDTIISAPQECDKPGLYEIIEEIED